MRRLRFTPEKIIAKLRQAEITLSQGMAVASICRQLSISEQTYYRWRKEYVGLKVSQAGRLKDLARKNQRLKKINK